MCLEGEEEALLRLDSSPLPFQGLMCFEMVVSCPPADEESTPRRRRMRINPTSQGEAEKRQKEKRKLDSNLLQSCVLEGEEEARPRTEVTDESMMELKGED
ncbi:hypothetical protein CDL15_Pgr006420 [Punica granatum]|uniref:Uncharacterized protein n=1 Tax=Punica granatum TaxID=22663 RepID=A0A218XZS1_PUNGR|nr:hypothetical protein CDL15_Pgr006420 [Punica granatum]